MGVGRRAQSPTIVIKYILIIKKTGRDETMSHKNYNWNKFNIYEHI